MKNTEMTFCQMNLTRLGLASSLIAALGITMPFTLTAGKGGGKPKGQFEKRYFDLVTEEVDASGDPVPVGDEVFWGDLCGAIGAIDADYPDDGITATGSSSSLGQPVELSNLLIYLDPLCDESDADLETCFPGITDPTVGFVAYGVVSIKRDDDPGTPGVEEVSIQKAINGGYAKNGREAHYTLTIRAEPSGGGFWSPLDLENPGDAASLVLLDWQLELTSGNPSRGCQLWGSFNAQAALTVIRRDGPLTEGECD